MSEPHNSLHEIQFWRDDPSMNAMEPDEHGDWVRRETVEDLVEQFEALVHAARKLQAEDEAWVFANRGREEAFYAAVEDVIAALPESNPASGGQTLREPSRSGGLRPESLPPETPSPASLPVTTGEGQGGSSRLVSESGSREAHDDRSAVAARPTPPTNASDPAKDA